MNSEMANAILAMGTVAVLPEMFQHQFKIYHRSAHKHKLTFFKNLPTFTKMSNY
jgi:hypothetical protein